MAEVVLGDLAQVKLFDILKPLLMGKKSGKVRLRGKETGEIFLEMGNIVHAKTPRYVGEYAFFAIMEWKAGKITYEADLPPKERTISPPTEQLLLNWSYRKQEWEKFRELVPSASAAFRISLQKSGEDKNLTADQWNVLALSNGVRTVAEVMKLLDWDEFKILKTIYQLAQSGLLEKVETEKAAKKKGVAENFFQVLELELKRVMGPVAPFVIDDKLTESRETRESLSQDQALSFLESLSEEIPNPQKRKEFIKAIGGLLSPEK